MFTFQRLDESDARAILSWQYEPPYDFYNNLGKDTKLLQHFLDAQNNFYSIFESRELVAYCSFGQDGQVAGGDYREEALDIGMGLRPNLTGRGKGVEYVNTVLEFADTWFKPKVFRVTGHLLQVGTAAV